MKKAVVLEIREEYAAVLTDEGLVQKIPDRSYAVGEEIELPDASGWKENYSAAPRRHLAGWYRAAAAAAVILAISGGGLFYASENAFAYSTVTVTTDDAFMELILNKKDEVVAVKALDEDSEKTASELDVSAAKRRTLSDTLEWITEGKEKTTVTVTSGNEEHRRKLEEKVTDMLPLPQAEKTVPMTESESSYSELNKSSDQGMQPSQGMMPEQRMPPGQDMAPEQEMPSEQGMAPEQGMSSGQSIAAEQGMPSGQGMAPEQGMPSEQSMAPEQGMPSEQGMAPEQGMPSEQGMLSGQEMMPQQGVPPVQEMRQPQEAGPHGGMGPAP